MGLLVNILVVVIRVLNFIILPFIFIFGKKKKTVPPITDKTLMISAKKLAILIRQGKLSSEDVVRKYINRIKEVNPLINAVVEERFEKALEDAKFVDEYLRIGEATEEELRKHKPLLGVPITIKSSCKLSGMDFSVGLDIRRGRKASSDGYTVAKMKASGAIPLLVSNTPELCMSWYCFNKLTGSTCNPYDLTRTSGGSSGGEGALLGAGASVIGIGSDVAGSIRIPAIFCGVFGHKPTPRIISMEGHFPYPTGEAMLDYFTMGPLTRYAEDLKVLMEIMCVPGTKNLRLHERVDLGKVRVYCMPELPKSFITTNVDIKIKRAVEKAAAFLVENCNCKMMEESNLANQFSDSFVCSVLLLLQLGGISKPLEEDKRNVIIELIKELFGQSKFTFSYLSVVLLQKFHNSTDLDKFHAMNEDLKRKLSEELRDDGVLICPSHPNVAPKQSEAFFKVFGLAYLPSFNTLGLPATQVPCGKGVNGLPIGLQVVAAPNQDRLCLAVAEELEKCFGGWIPPKE